ncbi:MAG: twin-arginine translocase TatA/TatE family subunit [Rhodospirillales bacterium]|nr:MAG: twin-arginine translocase TatA/TatE family subunit [Rhodospirillales bacterium]
MGGFGSIWHWVIVLIIVLLLFGAGKLPRLMGDMAKGVKAFKAGLKDEGEGEAAAGDQPKPIDPPAQSTVAEAKKDEAAKH